MKSPDTKPSWYPEYIDARPFPTLRMDAEDEGVVLKHGDSFDSFGARDIWVWENNGTYFMHYDAAVPNEGWLCALATSTDMKNWKKHGPVLDFGKPGQDDEKSASYGVTYFEDGIWHMFYVGTPNTSPPPDCIPAFPYMTCKAFSASPYGPWTKQPDMIPFRPIPNSYCCITASPGHIVKLDGEYLQFFSASDAEYEDIKQVTNVKRTISIARTKDIKGSWTIDAEPILPLEEQIENSSLYYEQSIETWFLFTNHIALNKNGEYTDAIWVYWTKDINHWNPLDKAVVLDKHNCKWSKEVIGLPSVLRSGDRLAIFYDGIEGQRLDHCHRDIGLAWLPLPLSVPSKD